MHTNSRIPNRAFYLVAPAVGGHAWEKGDAIWYATVRCPKLRPSAQFIEFANATVRAAIDLYGNGDWMLSAPSLPPGIKPGVSSELQDEARHEDHI